MILRQRMLLVILGPLLIIFVGMITYIGISTHQIAVDSVQSITITGNSL